MVPSSHKKIRLYYTCMATDVLIYSPTITAGVSLELPLFDQLVAFVDNAFYAPSVDTVLQQLFRVRVLCEIPFTHRLTYRNAI